jgi:hypothetical protein
MTERRSGAFWANGVAENKHSTTTEDWLASMAAAERVSPPLSIPLPMPAADELRILTTLAEVCQRLISIFTPDLEPPVYDNPQVIEVLKRFVLSHSFAKVRILVRDHTRHSGSSNRFMSMAKRLTSYLEIRILLPEHYHYTSSYCIADDRGIVYRLNAERWEGIATINSPPLARQYLQEFDLAWQASGAHFLRRSASM